MSSSSTTRSASTRARKSSRLDSQTSIDAKLHIDFEESKRLFDYSTSVEVNASTSTCNVPSSTISAYLQKMQRGMQIQPFGCLIAVNEQDFTLIAYSENAPEMLDLVPHTVPSMEQQEPLTFGTDVRTFFRSPGATALQKAVNFPDVNLMNPILLHCKSSGKPFYAILHRIDVGLLIDLEAVKPSDVPVTAAGALKSYKLAAKAIARLQSLSSGNITLMCNALVQEVADLTGYDRVMVYKFHEDEHGEVIAEYRRPDLESYLGLHYPATDIPQASRFLFVKNKVRIICDCLASPVKVIQDTRLVQPLSIGGSALRYPHGCHAQYMANMGSIASLVMSVTINEDQGERDKEKEVGKILWGLVVCHHTSARYVPFPLRYACEFVVQIFGVQVNKEVEFAAQLREKHIMQTQSMLCDMLLRDAPVGIITQSPNVMDLVKCDGAALYYNQKCWLLGVTPIESQIRDIAEWLLEYHNGSTGLSTDSLMEAGYPHASVLGESVCGMAVARITSRDFIFWFRSHTEKEIKWGGAQHNPRDKDEDRKMNPRSSFEAFLQVVKWRSKPWEDVEMDAIHSIQLILRESLKQDEAPDEDSKMIVNVQSFDDRIQKVDELRLVTKEMVRLIETAVVPIVAVDALGDISGWNSKVAELTGMVVEKAVGRPLADFVEEESVEVVKNMINLALQGTEERGVEIKVKTFFPGEKKRPVILVVNACCSRDMMENIVGVCFIAQDLTGQKLVMEKYTRMQGDYDGILRNPSSLIPPVFMTDESGRCSEWNDAIQKLSGLKREEVIDKMLLGEVFTVNNFGCRVKDHDTFTRLRIQLNAVTVGEDADNLLFGFFNKHGHYVEALLSANKRTDAEGRIIGIICFLHVASPELQYALQVQKISEQTAASSLSKLEYIRREIRKPINGIMFMQDLMVSSDLSNEQKQLLRTNISSQEQLTKIVDDTDIQGIEECYMELKCSEFNLGEALEAVKKQVSIPSQDREVHIIYDLPAEVLSMCLYGDNLRLQQVLSDFLSNTIRFSPKFEGSSITFKLIFQKKSIGTKVHIVHLEFRLVHPAPGLPEELMREMFQHSPGISREGLGLYISQKLVKIMNGNVQYIREAETSSLNIFVELPLVHQVDRKLKQKCVE